MKLSLIVLGETQRTVLGHLRHEVGHHYWRVLVEAPSDHARFRALFGDERVDYERALDTHYRRPSRPAPASHITHYATSHPAEDWAETFAHYLAIRDGLEAVDGDPIGASNADRGWVDDWRALSEQVNAVSAGLGHPPAYPYQITERVSQKLCYVHDRVLAEAHRSRLTDQR